MVTKNPLIAEIIDSVDCDSNVASKNTIEILAKLCKIVLKREICSLNPQKNILPNKLPDKCHSFKSDRKSTDEHFFIEKIKNLGYVGHPLIIEILLIPTVLHVSNSSSQKSPQYLPVFLIEQWNIQLLPRRLFKECSNRLDDLSGEIISFCTSSLVNKFLFEERSNNGNEDTFTLGYRIVNLRNASAFKSCWFYIKLDEKSTDFIAGGNFGSDYGALVNKCPSSFSLPTRANATENVTIPYSCSFPFHSESSKQLSQTKTHFFTRFSIDEIDVIDASITSVSEWPAEPPASYQSFISRQEAMVDMKSNFSKESENLRKYGKCSLNDAGTSIESNSSFIPKIPKTSHDLSSFMFKSPLGCSKKLLPLTTRFIVSDWNLNETESETGLESHSFFNNPSREIFSNRNPNSHSDDKRTLFQGKCDICDNSNFLEAHCTLSKVNKSLFPTLFTAKLNSSDGGRLKHPPTTLQRLDSIQCSNNNSSGGPNEIDANKSCSISSPQSQSSFSDCSSGTSKLISSFLPRAFHCKTGLPLNSSPVPIKRLNSTSFDYDETLISQRHTNTSHKFENTVQNLTANSEVPMRNGSETNSPSCDNTDKVGFNSHRSNAKINRRPNTLSLTNNCPDRLFSKRYSYDNKSTFSPLSLKLLDTGCSQQFLPVTTPQPMTSQQLLINFEESMLNGRIPPSGIVDGFMLDIGASGSFFPSHLKLPVNTYFFNLSDDHAPSPYLGYVDLSNLTNKRGYRVPQKGSVQLTLFNPSNSVLKMFVIQYNLEDMPANCQTFIRQRTVFMPVKTAISAEKDQPKTIPVDSSAGLLFVSGLAIHEQGRVCHRKSRICRPFSTSEQHTSTAYRRFQSSELPTYLRYLVHLRFQTTNSGNLYLHTDIRLIFAREKIEFDPRIAVYEMRSFVDAPSNPRYSPKKYK